MHNHRFTTALKNLYLLLKSIYKTQLLCFIENYKSKCKRNNKKIVQKKKEAHKNMKNVIIYIIMIAVFAFIINHYFIRRKV